MLLLALYCANCYHAQSDHFTFIVHKQLNHLLEQLHFSALNRPGLVSFKISCPLAQEHFLNREEEAKNINCKFRFAQKLPNICIIQ